MLDNMIKVFLSLYINHSVCLVAEEKIYGELIAVTENDVVLSQNGKEQKYAFSEINDIRYVGELTDYQTIRGGCVIDDMYEFELSALADDALKDKIRYKEFDCRISCHLIFQDNSIKAVDVQVEEVMHVLKEEILKEDSFLYFFTEGDACTGRLERDEEAYYLVQESSPEKRLLERENVSAITRAPKVQDNICVVLKYGEEVSGIVAASGPEACNIFLENYSMKTIAYRDIKRLLFYGTVTESASDYLGIIDEKYYCKPPYYLKDAEQKELFWYGAKVRYLASVNKQGLIAKEVEILSTENSNSTEVGIIVSITKNDGLRIGFIGNKYVVPSCGATVSGNVIFQLKDINETLNMADNIYVVEYALTGKRNARDQKLSEVKKIIETIPKKEFGIVEVIGETIKKYPIYQAVIHSDKGAKEVYLEKEVEITCVDGSVQCGRVIRHDAAGFVLTNNKDVIAYDDIQEVRICEKILYNSTDGTGRTESGMFYHVNESRLTSEEQNLLYSKPKVSYMLANNCGFGREKRQMQDYFNVMGLRIVKDKPDVVAKTEETAEDVQGLPCMNPSEFEQSLHERFEKEPKEDAGFGFYYVHPKTGRVYVNAFFGKGEKLPALLDSDKVKMAFVNRQKPIQGRIWLVYYAKNKEEYLIEFVCWLEKTAEMERVRIVEKDKLDVTYSGTTVFYEYELQLGQAVVNYYGLTEEEMFATASREGVTIFKEDLRLWRMGILRLEGPKGENAIINGLIKVKKDVIDPKIISMLSTNNHRMVIAYFLNGTEVIKVKAVPDEVVRLIPWAAGKVTSSEKTDDFRSVTVNNNITHYLTVRSDGLVSSMMSNKSIKGKDVWVKTITCLKWAKTNEKESVAIAIHLKRETATIRYNTNQDCYMAYRNQTQFARLDGIGDAELKKLENQTVEVLFQPSGENKAYLQAVLEQSKVLPKDNAQQIENFKGAIENAMLKPERIYQELYSVLKDKDYIKSLCKGDECFEQIFVLCETLVEAKRQNKYSVLEESLSNAFRDLSKTEMQKQFGKSGLPTEMKQVFEGLCSKLMNQVRKDLDDLYKSSYPIIDCRLDDTQISKQEPALCLIISNADNRQNATQIELSLKSDELDDTMLQSEPERMKKTLETGTEREIRFTLDLSKFEGDSFRIEWNAKFTCVGGFENDCKRLATPVAKGSLEVMLAEQTMINKEEVKNPYTVPAKGMPLSEKTKMFFGRSGELKEFWNHVLDEDGYLTPGKVTIIYGQKRSGKSSLVNQIIKELKDEERKYSGDNTYIVSIPDMSSVGEMVEAASSFYLSLYGEIFTQLDEMVNDKIKKEVLLDAGCKEELLNGRLSFKNYVINNQYTDGASNTEEDAAALLAVRMKTCLRVLCKGTKDHPRNNNIVVVMDEFTRLCVRVKRKEEAGDKEWKDVPWLIQRLSKLGLIPIVIGHAFMMASLEKLGVLNSLEQIDVYEMEVFALLPDDSKKLICEPMKNAFQVEPYNTTSGERAVAKLLDLSGRSPYVLMKLCDRMFEYYQEMPGVRISETDVINMVKKWFTYDGSEKSKKFSVGLFDMIIVEADDNETVLLEGTSSWKLLEQIVELSEESSDRKCLVKSVYESCSLGREKSEQLMTEMERRRVVELQGGYVKIIMGLFDAYVQFKLKEVE